MPSLNYLPLAGGTLTGPIILGPISTASSGVNFASNGMVLNNSYWNGAAAATAELGCSFGPLSGTNPAMYFRCSASASPNNPPSGWSYDFSNATNPILMPTVSGTSATFSGTVAAGTSVTTPLLNNVVNACSFAGSTADVQIANAFASLPSSQGTVDGRCYGTTTQILAAPIVIGPGQGLILTQATLFVPASATSDVVQIAITGSVYGLRANLATYASTYSGSVVDSTCASAQDTFVNIQHIYVTGAAAGATGAAVKLNCAQAVASGITGADVSDIISYGLDDPLQLDTSGSGFINGNMFSNLFLVSNPSSGKCIDLQNAGLEIRGNIFSGVCEAGTTSIYSTNTGTNPIQANVFNINAYDSTDSWAISGIVEKNILTGNLDGAVADNGLNTINDLSRNSVISNASVSYSNGFNFTTQPTTFVANPLPSLGLSSQYIQVGTSEVTFGVFPLLASTPWRVVFLGIWGNTANPRTSIMPALYTEVSSSNPSVQVGSLTATVSLNSSNVLQIACPACGASVIYFSGLVIPAGAGYMTDVSNSASFTGTVAAGTITPTTIGSSGVLLNGVPALQSQTSLYNYYSGGAGNLTATGNYNAANGFQALYANTTGSGNTANGYQALFSNTTGSYNTANGDQALYYNTTGNFNTANGLGALFSNTTGNYNTVNGFQALFSNTTGNSNTANGYYAGHYITGGAVGLTNPTTSIFIGNATQAKADNGTNEIVIGAGVTGNGSNTATLGTGLTDTYLAGTQHITATIPTASAGSVATYSTNAGGKITGLSAATSVTITFANSGWANTAFCVANASVSLATNIYVSANNKTSVTFTFPSLTGTLYYHCDGN
jgi:hypothetical protein